MFENNRVLAIIPVYKNYAQRDKCIAALEAQTVPVDVFTHDNTHDNIGFTKACNRGLREAIKTGRKYAMLINQDCYAEPDAVEQLIRFMDAHERCAIAGPMQVDAANPDLIVNAGGLQAYPFGQHRGNKLRSGGELSTSEPISWANGACMFARMEAVVEFGLHDEGMFLIGSDSDWSFTARARGWEVWYCAESVVRHEGGISNSMPPAEVQSIFHKDMDYWRRKWFGTVTHRQLDRPPGPPQFAVPIAHVLHKARSEHQAGRVIEAEILYRDILAIEPNNVDAINLMGVLAMQYNLVVMASDLFKRAVELAPENPQLHMHYANSLANMDGRQADAIQEFREAARLENHNPQTLEVIATALAQLGQPNDAASVRAKSQSLQQQIARPLQGGTGLQ